MIIDFPSTFAKVGPALQRTGNWDPTKAWGTDGLASSSLPEDVAPQILEGMRGTAPGAPEKGEAEEAFRTLYDSSDPRDVEAQTFDAQQFDATILCYLAAVAAGSTDGKEMAMRSSHHRSAGIPSTPGSSSPDHRGAAER